MKGSLPLFEFMASVMINFEKLCDPSLVRTNRDYKKHSETARKKITHIAHMCKEDIYLK